MTVIHNKKEFNDIYSARSLDVFLSSDHIRRCYNLHCMVWKEEQCNSCNDRNNANNRVNGESYQGTSIMTLVCVDPVHLSSHSDWNC